MQPTQKLLGHVLFVFFNMRRNNICEEFSSAFYLAKFRERSWELSLVFIQGPHPNDSILFLDEGLSGILIRSGRSPTGSLNMLGTAPPVLGFVVCSLCPRGRTSDRCLPTRIHSTRREDSCPRESRPPLDGDRSKARKKRERLFLIPFEGLVLRRLSLTFLRTRLPSQRSSRSRSVGTHTRLGS